MSLPLTFAALCALLCQEQGSGPGIALDDASFAAWRDHIRASPEDRSWADLPWQTTFHDGLVEAREQGRPLLLWAMNGHPLGCT